MLHPQNPLATPAAPEIVEKKKLGKVSSAGLLDSLQGTIDLIRHILLSCM
jgi:hypothetical protein